MLKLCRSFGRAREILKV